MRNTSCPMDKPAVQGPSTVCETYLVNKLAQLLTCGINQSALSARVTWSGPDWLYHSNLYIAFLVVNFLNIPCLSCNVIGASSKHIRSFPHSRFSWYARNCFVRPTLLWVPYQPSKCVTHIENYVFWLAPDKYNFTLPLKRAWHLHTLQKFRLFDTVHISKCLVTPAKHHTQDNSDWFHALSSCSNPGIYLKAANCS